MIEREEFYISINEYNVHVVQERKDRKFPYLIFLHDALGSVETWRSFPFDLARELPYNVVIYSRRGHGKSDSLLSNKGLDLFEVETLELRMIINALKLEKVILIGSSDGGTIALNYATKYNVVAVVSIAGHYINELATFNGVQSSQEEPFNSQLRVALEKYHDKKAEVLVDSWQKIWTDDQFRSWKLKGLEGIACPVLIVQGKKDEYATDFHALSLGKLIPKSTVYLMEEVGHFPHKENVIETSKVLNGFLKKLEK